MKKRLGNVLALVVVVAVLGIAGYEAWLFANPTPAAEQLAAARAAYDAAIDEIGAADQAGGLSASEFFARVSVVLEIFANDIEDIEGWPGDTGAQADAIVAALREAAGYTRQLAADTEDMAAYMAGRAAFGAALTALEELTEALAP